MAIGIDELDDDDDDVLESPSNEGEPQVIQPTPQQQEPDFMSDFLKSRGIDDPTKIKFEDENGGIIERSWNDLTHEERMNIANTPLDYPDNGEQQYDPEELALINEIRNSGMTPSQYIQAIQGQTIVQEPVYKVDELSDDELFLLDLARRVGDGMTDEEGAQALAAAKQNEDFFKKHIEGIRKEYKEQEDYVSRQQEAQEEEERRIAYENYQAYVVDAINDLTSIGSFDLDLEDADKNDLADFMLSQDENGVTYFTKALNDPANLVKAAWFVLNGEEAFDEIQDYFKREIKKVAQNQYNKGLMDGKNGVKPAVMFKTDNKQTPHRTYKTIEDLDDED